MLGAAKWLLEKEGPTLKKLLTDNPVGEKLGFVVMVVTFSSLGNLVGTNHFKLMKLCVQQGYMLVLTGHSLGGAVAALLAMLIHDSAHAHALGIFPTTLGIKPKKIMCWSYGCAPCVDQSIAENTTYIHSVVLQVRSRDLNLRC